VATVGEKYALSRLSALQNNEEHFDTTKGTPEKQSTLQTLGEKAYYKRTRTFSPLKSSF